MRKKIKEKIRKQKQNGVTVGKPKIEMEKQGEELHHGLGRKSIKCW